MTFKVNLIPMAGEGRRFIEDGYNIPKPLIEIAGVPMVIRAAKALPDADRWIFICRDIHISQFKIDTIIKKYFNNSIIISVEKLTQGQAITCLLGKEYIPDDSMLTIGPSDNDMLYNKCNYLKLVEDPEINGLVWTFKNSPTVLKNPKMYGWVKVNNLDTKIEKISCKEVISTKPFEDHAVIGAFTFKKAKLFFEAVNLMIDSNDRVNDEFYVDTVINHAIQSGNTFYPFLVDHYIGWGTPNDLKYFLKTYEYFEKVFYKQF